MGMTKTSAHRRPFTPLPTLRRDAAKVSNEPNPTLVISFCMRTQHEKFRMSKKTGTATQIGEQTFTYWSRHSDDDERKASIWQQRENEEQTICCQHSHHQ